MEDSLMDAKFINITENLKAEMGVKLINIADILKIEMKKGLNNLSNKLQSEMNTVFRIVTNNADKLLAEINMKFYNSHAEIYNLKSPTSKSKWFLCFKSLQF